MKNDTDTIIIGAGLSGLTLAHNLKKEGRKVLLLESSDRVGGVINTHEENGFVFESGPNTGVLGSAETVKLFDELNALCELEIANSSAKNRFIWKGNRWRAMPSGLISAAVTPLFSLYDKFRILGEPLRKPGKNPYESVADLVRRRMGKSFLEYAVDPFISGVYAGDPEKLITKFALPKLYKLEQEYGSFITGSVKKARESKTDLERRATRDVMSVKGGLKNLIRALTISVGRENMILNCTGIKTEQTSSGYIISINGERPFSCSSVVSTIGGESLPEIFPFADQSLMEDINNLRYARVVQVAAGFRKWDGIKLNAFGGLVPSKENRKILGVLFPSSIFKGRAPEGGALLSIFLGGYKNAEIVDMPDLDIRNLVINELKYTMKTQTEPELLKIFRYRKAIPQYEISSEKRFEAIEKVEKAFPGIYLAGNIVNGIGISDRIVQASKVAQRISSK